ncbi:hypothetical protein EVA_16554 [gut metagenome]|uniref:Uncharacterized protein n=1 Tax=gut metagenome TaxID=749906 RepID=J9C667_9ZZZZ
MISSIISFFYGSRPAGWQDEKGKFRSLVCRLLPRYFVSGQESSFITEKRNFCMYCACPTAKSPPKDSRFVFPVVSCARAHTFFSWAYSCSYSMGVVQSIIPSTSTQRKRRLPVRSVSRSGRLRRRQQQKSEAAWRDRDATRR